MIIYFNRDGSVLGQAPSLVVQGSSSYNDIYCVAPISNDNTVSVAFNLPNGVNTRKHFLTYDTELNGVVDTENSNFSVYRITLPAKINKMAGVVKAQFYFTAPNGSTMATESVSFTVQKGVSTIQPEDVSTWEEFIEYLTDTLTHYLRAPTGGEAGQYLRKTETGTEWASIPSGEDKENKFRYTSVQDIPTASEHIGEIIEYIGTTTSSYTNGYFYKSVLIDGGYAWKQVDVQPKTSIGGASGEIDLDNGLQILPVGGSRTKPKLIMGDWVEVNNDNSASFQEDIVFSKKAMFEDKSKLVDFNGDPLFLDDYNNLINKPMIYGNVLEGNQTASDLGLASSEDVSSLQIDVALINGKIPSQASSSNQLADKNFVNSSVATNTANYISKDGQPFSSVAELQAYSGTLTNNDYAFVTGTDSSGNTYYDRYKYTIGAGGGVWAKEYRLNNSSFTAMQWASINSTITEADVLNLRNLTSQVVIVHSNNYKTLTDSQSTAVPDLNLAQLLAIYNYITAGKIVYIEDSLGDNRTLVYGKAPENDMITIYSTYLNRLELKYQIVSNSVEISFTEIGGSGGSTAIPTITFTASQVVVPLGQSGSSHHLSFNCTNEQKLILESENNGTIKIDLTALGASAPVPYIWIKRNVKQQMTIPQTAITLDLHQFEFTNSGFDYSNFASGYIDMLQIGDGGCIFTELPSSVSPISNILYIAFEQLSVDTALNRLAQVEAKVDYRIAYYHTLPEPTPELSGKVVQYVGETEGTLVNGYFYKCIPGIGSSYQWVQIDVQPSQSNFSLIETVTLAEDVTVFERTNLNLGNGYKEVLVHLFYPQNQFTSTHTLTTKGVWSGTGSYNIELTAYDIQVSHRHIYVKFFDDHNLKCIAFKSSNYLGEFTAYRESNQYVLTGNPLTSVKLTDSVKIPSGTQIEIYAR